jgi:hypothetical protein
MVIDDGYKELAQHINTLRLQIGILSESLLSALAYIDTDSHSSLTKCRTVTEKMLRKVYRIEMEKEPRQGMIGYILSDKEFISKIPKRIVARINFIRDLSNIGPHGGEANIDDARLVLEETIHLMDWFISKYDLTNFQKMGDAQSIEIFPELKEKYGEKLQQNIKSIKFIQEQNRCYVEVTLSQSWSEELVYRTDLEFFGDDPDYDNPPFYIMSFDPKNKIAENVRKFLDEFDESSLRYCDGLFD